MSRRSRAREVALQLLYHHDINSEMSRSWVEKFVHERINEQGSEVFCLTLYDGVTSQLTTIDAQLTSAADNWKLARMTTVDRNVLRLGAFEILHSRETPAAVAIDESIELVRRYGTEDSPAFVNGVLDRILQVKKAEANSQPASASPDGAALPTAAESIPETAP